jgi:hypothetical protein
LPIKSPKTIGFTLPAIFIFCQESPLFSSYLPALTETGKKKLKIVNTFAFKTFKKALLALMVSHSLLHFLPANDT